MPVINVEIPAELYREFKLGIVERLGGKRGDMTKALEEAIRLWLSQKPHIRSF